MSDQAPLELINLTVQDAYVIKPQPKGDSRGFFGRLFCASFFAKAGLNPLVMQINNSLSEQKGTLRGLHYQLAPRQETKLVRCVRGAIWDVVLDLRKDSPTYKKWHAQELSADNRLMMYVPQGCAHGFITLEHDTEIIYFVSESYAIDLERGVRWDDAQFGIKWPLEPTVISEKDLSHSDYGSS